MKLDRRTFIRLTAMAAATAALDPLGAAASPGGIDAALARRAGDGVEWDKAPCRFCGTGCHVQVGVKDGKVVATAGDLLAPVNKGLLCVKGYHVGAAMYGEDRLTTPLLRVNGKLEPVTWSKALDVIADRVLKGPEGFAMYGSGQWTIPEGYAAQKFMKGILSSNHIDPNARLCMASAVTGFLSTYGVDEPACCYDDLDDCDVVITWGNNPVEMHPVLFSRIIDRKAKGEQVAVIDLGTRRTRTTDAAERYLQFRPHTDLAIANGVAYLLLERGTYNRKFVEQHCAFRGEGGHPLFGKAVSFSDYRAGLQRYTPEYVQSVSGVPAAEIEHLADLFGNPDTKIVSLWCMGANQHTRGTAMNNLIHNLHLISGHFGRPGDGPQSLTGQPSACGTVREVGTLAHALPGGRLVGKEPHRRETEKIWNLPEGRINPKPGYHTVKMWEKFSTPTDKGGDIHTIWVQVTNPGQTLPNLGKLFKGSRELADKFLICSDVYPTATTRVADLVLPSAMWVEKNGIVGNSERRTQQWFKMVDPPGDARDDCWQIIAAARRLYDRGFDGAKDREGGFAFAMKDEAGAEAPVWEWERYYGVNVDEQLFEEYRRFTRMKHKDLAPYREYVSKRGMRWPVVEQPDGSWRETRYRFAGFDDPYVAEGKGIQFYHSSSKDDRAQIWVRHYEPPPEGPDDEYPFWLCTGRVLEHWHTGSMTMRIPQLRNSVPNAYVEMNGADARKLSIANGEIVDVQTRRGSLKLPVWVDGRGAPPEGSLFIPFFDERLMVNDLTLELFDPVSKQPDYKKCAARIRKAPRRAGRS